MQSHRHKRFPNRFLRGKSSSDGENQEESVDIINENEQAKDLVDVEGVMVGNKLCHFLSALGF